MGPEVGAGEAAGAAGEGLVAAGAEEVAEAGGEIIIEGAGEAEAEAGAEAIGIGLAEAVPVVGIAIGVGVLALEGFNLITELRGKFELIMWFD
jgi:hypothetical protein